jgi:HlyD family secretion protein
MNFHRASLRLAAAVLLLHVPAAPAAPAGEQGAQTTSPWIALARGRVEPPGGIIQIAASRDGIVKEVFAREGDQVVKNQVLATLDDGTVRLNLALAKRERARAHAALLPLQIRQAAAERECRRLEALVAGRLANAQDLDQARDQVAILKAEIAQASAGEDAAQVQVDLAQHEVEARVVRAPADGMIVRRLASPGEGASTQQVTPLFWLAPNGPRVVIAQLDVDAVRLVATGDSAEVVTEATPAQVIKAKVQKIGVLFGPRRPSTDDPAERQDVRVVDCTLVVENGAPLLIGQRVVVRFLRPAQ